MIQEREIMGAEIHVAIKKAIDANVHIMDIMAVLQTAQITLILLTVDSIKKAGILK